MDKDLKLAILIGVIPKDYQDMLLQAGITTKKMEYEVCRDRVIQIATQRMQMSQPTPMDVGMLNKDQGYGDTDTENVDVVGQGIKCYICQGMDICLGIVPPPNEKEKEKARRVKVVMEKVIMEKGIMEKGILAKDLMAKGSIRDMTQKDTMFQTKEETEGLIVSLKMIGW